MSAELPIWVVYDHPRDFPDGYIARKHVVQGNGAYGPTGDFMSTPNLELLRVMLQARGLVHLDRMEGDDPVILETWL